ncbi:MAG: D-2-hydroxyacid dehydrogenase, partial [Actinomycetales bacterium]
MPATPVVVVANPFEPELVERIRSEVLDAEVVYEPDLVPPPRFPSDHRGDPGFRRSEIDERRWRSLLERADVLLGIPADTPDGLAAAVREWCPHLSWVQGTAAGTGEVVQKAGLTAKELQRVTVTSAIGVHAEQLAEWTTLALLAFTKDLSRLLADKAAHRWGHYPVRELRGQRLLVVGLGHIGREIARQAHALGMHVTGAARSGGSSGAGEASDDFDEVAPVDQLPDLVSAADAVVLALPRTAATEGLFSAEVIARMPSHAVLVNVGRGATVDETALIEALRDRRIAGAALEVFATEPLPEDSPLWDLDN